MLGQLGYPAPPEEVGPRLERLAASDADQLFLADVDGAVVGLAGLHTSLSLEYDQPAAKISALVVDEEWRGRGVGQALVAALEQEARAQGCGLLFLTTNERRADAHAFYARLGFEHTGRRYGKAL